MRDGTGEGEAVPPARPARLADSDLIDRFVQVGAYRVRVRTSTGTEPVNRATVVLVHGLVSTRYLLPTARRLACTFRVLAPDLPGFGRSPGPRRALGIAGLADVVASLLDQAGVEHATVLGHSVGAQVVAELAARRPDAVGRIVLAGPTLDPAARSIVRLYGRWLRNAPREPLALNRVLVRDMVESGPVTMLGTLRRALRDDIVAKLAAVAVPTLVVRGAGDTIAPRDWVQHLAAVAHDGRPAEIARAAHTVVYSAPADLAELVATFARAGTGTGTWPATRPPW